MLGIRLRGLTDASALAAEVPAGWAPALLRRVADDEFGVLTQATAVVELFMALERSAGPAARHSAEQLREKFAPRIRQIVARLIMIGVAPPGPRDLDALVLLGRIARYNFDNTSPQLQMALQRPMGFRLLRAITKLVHLGKDNESFVERRLKPWINQLIVEHGHRLGIDSIYPARSLDLELAISVPASWSPPHDDWITQFLLSRAINPAATIRERGTAAHGLWQRALDNERISEIEPLLRELVAAFREKDARPDAANGLQWVAATLEHVKDARVPVCNEWPQSGERWQRSVASVASSLAPKVPNHLSEGTQSLFNHILLQNAGVERRTAIETLVAGGWTQAITRSLGNLLGFLQERDDVVANIMVEAFEEACVKATQREPTRAQVMELHAAIFGLGDCFGSSASVRPGMLAVSIRGLIADRLSTLISHKSTEPLVARAVAYLLTVIARDPAGPDKSDLSLLLLTELKSRTSDPVTKDLCAWAIRSRFDQETGKVIPLLLAPLG